MLKLPEFSNIFKLLRIRSLLRKMQKNVIFKLLKRFVNWIKQLSVLCFVL